MFGARIIANMAFRTLPITTFKPIHSFATLSPIYTEITSMLGKSMLNPNTVALRNLRELIARTEEDVEMDMDINGVSQLTLIVQVSQTGLIKQARLTPTLSESEQNQHQHPEWTQLCLC